MGTCTDLASKAELQEYLPKSEKAGIINSAVSLSGQAVQGILAIQGGKVAQALNASLAAQAKGEALLAATRTNASAIQNASSAAAAANRQALIAKGAALQNANALSSAQATANSALATANQAVAAATSLAARLAALLASVAITVASFALTQGQLRATQARIDQQEKALEAYNADYTRLINLISQNKIAIEANNTAIEATNATVRNNQNAIAATNSLALDAQSTNRSLATSLNEANARINSLVNELNAVNSKVSVATSIAVATSNKLPPVPVIKDLSEVQNLSAENNRLRRQVELQQSDLNGYRVALNNLYARLPTQEDKFITRKVREQAITNASGIKDLNDQFIGIPSKIGQTVKSEFSNNIQTFKQDAQKQVSQTIANINFPEFDIKKVSREFDAKIAKISTDFNERLRSEISTIPKLQPTEVKQIVKTEVNSQIGGIAQVNNQQAVEINSKLDNLNSKFPDPLTLAGIATAVGGLDILRQIKNKPIPTPTCLAPVLVPPVGAGVTKANVAIGTMQSLTLAQGAGIKTVVTKNFDILSHSKHGLEAVQKFADIAWKATHADKILNGITTALVIHNAIMLSNNLGQTIGDAASGVLNAIGIKDSEGNPFNVNTVIRAKMTQLITSAIGSENYAALTAKVAAANRIYQSAANVLDLTRSLFDSARNVAELTAENTGKIGNALREAGAVYEDAYDLMQEKVNPQNQAQRRLEGLSNTLGNLAEGASAISEISSEVVETRENITQLKAERKQLEDETKLFLDAEKVKKDEVKTESQAETELAKIDFAKDETDD